jgi:hypothetical protein
MGHMCSHTITKEIPEKKFRLADFFNTWWNTYAKNPKRFITTEQYQAVNAIRVCRTAALGADIYACPECGEISEIYHSCKNRFCPSCSWKDTVVWAEKVKLRMLNIPHRHIVCTLPHSLTGIIKRNQYVLLGTLMRTSADVFKDWMLSKHGIRIGIISVLHTFGEEKKFHVHVHMIVSWGGVRPKYNTLKIIESEYVRYNFLQNKFRCKFEDELISMFDRGELVNDFIDRQDFLRFIKEVNNNDWVIHLEPPMDTPEKVIRYIGRYSKRACLSEYKITNIEGEFISFKHKDNRDRDKNNKPKEKICELHYRDFFPRLLQHVPLPNFKLVRYYGLYSNKGSVPQEYLYKKEEENIPVKEEKQEDPRQCKECSIEKEYIHTIFDRREKNERTTMFDINKHRHLIVIRHKRIAA